MDGVSLAARLAAAIASNGPMPVSAFVDAALYDPREGFYATTGQAGRRGDFLTAPEVGPLFGAVVARAVDQWWAEAGRPESFVVAEHGAGPGTLARSVMAAEPECATSAALTWVMVETSAAQRSLHPAGERLRSVAPGDAPAADVVLANELLDNLPFDLVGSDGNEWFALEVTAGPARFELVPTTSVEPPADLGAVEGGVVPVPVEARDWLATVDARRVVVFDYQADLHDLVARADGPVRAYRGHQRHDWLVAPGSADITVDVVPELAFVARPPQRSWSQAEWLREHGIDELVAEGRAYWEANAATGNLAAIRARSRIREAEALLETNGLGSFGVWEWLA